MTGIYWYISRQKLEALKESYGTHRGSWLRELSVKLKAPFAEAGATIKLDEGQTLFKDIDGIADNLLRGAEAPAVGSLRAGEAAAFFTFHGCAHRAVERGAYWVVMAEGDKALLLAGSASNAIGAPTTDSQEISPTIDPIAAVQRAFGEEVHSSATTGDVGADCSYVWQAIANPVRKVWEGLPRVQGIATFGGMFLASKGQLRRAGFSTLSYIVIGSPLYIRQF
jgi:hypothetical protein